MLQQVKITNSLRFALTVSGALALFSPPRVWASPQLSVMQGAMHASGDNSTTLPVLMLHMDGANGATNIPDSMKGVITAVGSAALSTSTAVIGTASLLFPGAVGNYIKASQSSFYAMGTLDFTIEAFIKTSSATNQTILGQWDGSNAGAHTIFTIQSTGQLGLYMADINENNAVLSGGTGANDGRWHHVAYTRSGNTHTLWLDGANVGSLIATGVRFVDNIDLFIGQYQCCLAFPYKGYIDELRITRGKALYTSSFVPPTTSLYDGNVPASIANLALRFDASARSTVFQNSTKSSLAISNGQSICAWTDLVTNLDALQATTANCPSLVTNALNGLPIVRFNGTSSRLISNSRITLTTPITIFVVAKDSATTSMIGGVFSHGGTSTPGPGLMSNGSVYWMDGSGGDSAGSANTTSAINTFRVITAIYTQNNSSSTYMYTNGTQESFYTGGGYGIAPGSGQIQLGGRTWDGYTDRLFKGDLGEVLVYNRKLTTTEISTISNWLRAKWGF